MRGIRRFLRGAAPLSAMAARRVGVGLIGLGTIGTGVAKVLRKNADVIAQRLGFPLRLVRIADLDTSRDRGVDLVGHPLRRATRRG